MASKFRVEYLTGGTGYISEFIRDRDTGKARFASIEEAHQVILTHKFTISDGPKPLMWRAPSVRILEYLPPAIVRQYRITPDGPVPRDER